MLYGWGEIENVERHAITVLLCVSWAGNMFRSLLLCVGMYVYYKTVVHANVEWYWGRAMPTADNPFSSK